MPYLYTGTNTGGETIHAGLTTQILIQVDGKSVGAIQSLQVTQNRTIKKIVEVGTDGIIEAVPNAATEVGLEVDRIYFDRQRLTESFGRGFHNIHSQRNPFEIIVYDYSRSGSNTNAKTATDLDLASSFGAPENEEGVIKTVFEGCWFAKLDVTYSSSEYIISERASIACEFVSTSYYTGGNASDGKPTRDDKLERLADTGRRGSLDARGLSQIAKDFNQ